MKTIKFTEAVATGNDFIIIDNRASSSVVRRSSFVKKICDRNRGVGADGLLLIERSSKADFTMRIFNSDGSEAEMCGNGSRCIALYAKEKRIAPGAMTIDTVAGILRATVRKDVVKVLLPAPKDITWNLCLTIGRCPYKVSFVNTGVPHVVYFTDDLEKVDVKELGSSMRYHKEFSPHGANADFVKILNKRSIRVRTYERGVEDETLACGTGSVASAIIAAEYAKMESPVTVETRSGERLKVYFEMRESDFTNVYLEGKAALVFDGMLRR